MNVRYSLTFKEYLQFVFRGMQQMRRRDWVVLGSVFGFWLLSSVGFYIYHAYREPYYLPVDIQRSLIILCLLPFALICWPLEGWCLKLEIHPEGIVVRRPIVSIQMPWNAIKVMDEDTGFIYTTFRDRNFKLTGASSLDVLIPKRAFANAEDAEKFYEQAQLFCQEAGVQPSAARNSLTKPLPH